MAFLTSIWSRDGTQTRSLRIGLSHRKKKKDMYTKEIKEQTHHDNNHSVGGVCDEKH